MSRAGMRWRWDVRPRRAEAAELAGRLKLTPLLAQVLYNRGLTEPEPIRQFLSPKLSDLHEPTLLSGVEAAADRICQAVRDGRKICIYGDYDVDGMTAIAILCRCLALAGAAVDYYVPHRLEEGYGVNQEAVEKIAAGGTGLMVTVDCGISSMGPLGRAAELGLEVIVTDHHAPGEALPPAAAIVHPGLGDYPNRELSGAGVAFKLAWQVARGLCGNRRVDERMKAFLLEATSLAALGTIADVVPLVGENRVLASFGLRGLAGLEHAGIRALIDSAGLAGEKIDAYHVGFCLAPRLNACGRMGHAGLAVELLTRPDPARCREIADYLHQQNLQRQRIEREIYEQAVEMVCSGRTPGPREHALVLASPEWHAGVVGIVASRMVERFGRPTVLLATPNGQAQGSARSVRGFNMRDALAACAGCLTSFGGHAMAAGLRLPAEKVPQFAAEFARYAAAHLTPEQLEPALSIEAEAELGELTEPVVQRLESLAPFGHGNPRPLLAVRRCRMLTPPQRMGRDGKAISFIVAQAPAGARGAGGAARAGSALAGRIRCVGFGMGELADRIAVAAQIDLAGEPVINRFNGRSSVELHLRDVALDPPE